MSDFPNREGKTTEEFKDDLVEWLDNNPCPKCGGHYDLHIYLTNAEIKEARDEGSAVSICNQHLDASDGWDSGVPRRAQHWCRVTEIPNNPCDEVFMEEIST